MLAARRSSAPGVRTRFRSLRVALWRSAGQAFAPGRWTPAGFSPLRVAAIQLGGGVGNAITGERPTWIV